MLVTVFTPTYNRGYIIGELYKSLCNQTCNDFEWIIVDDGSTDNTETIVTGFGKDDMIPIRYIWQENGGKHRAINRGVKEAKGELFYIVDSDDRLAEMAIEIIKSQYKEVRVSGIYAGVCGVCAYFNGERVGGDLAFTTINCNAVDLRYKYNIKGDMSEVFRTSVMKEFPFPEIDGERFCPEALVWNRISDKYIMRYFNEKIYFCEYRNDGLTASIVKVRMQSPTASTMYYSELIKKDIPFKQKIKASINYWRFYFFKLKVNKPKISFAWRLTMPIGYVMHINDLRRL